MHGVIKDPLGKLADQLWIMCWSVSHGAISTDSICCCRHCLLAQSRQSISSMDSVLFFFLASQTHSMLCNHERFKVCSIVTILSLVYDLQLEEDKSCGTQSI